MHLGDHVSAPRAPTTALYLSILGIIIQRSRQGIALHDLYRVRQQLCEINVGVGVGGQKIGFLMLQQFLLEPEVQRCF